MDSLKANHPTSVFHTRQSDTSISCWLCLVNQWSLQCTHQQLACKFSKSSTQWYLVPNFSSMLWIPHTSKQCLYLCWTHRSSWSHSYARHATPDSKCSIINRWSSLHWLNKTYCAFCSLSALFFERILNRLLLHHHLCQSTASLWILLLLTCWYPNLDSLLSLSHSHQLHSKNVIKLKDDFNLRQPLPSWSQDSNTVFESFPIAPNLFIIFKIPKFNKDYWVKYWGSYMKSGFKFIIKFSTKSLNCPLFLKAFFSLNKISKTEH